jgi:hypothetical protein
MSDEIKDAVKYISQELLHNPDADLNKLVESACLKFDLNPLQADFLVNKFIHERSE